MVSMASQITSLTTVYSTVYSGADQRKHQSSVSLAFVRIVHRWIPRTNGQYRWKCFHLMTSSWSIAVPEFIVMTKLTSSHVRSPLPKKIYLLFQVIAWWCQVKCWRSSMAPQSVAGTKELTQSSRDNTFLQYLHVVICTPLNVLLFNLSFTIEISINSSQNINGATFSKTTTWVEIDRCHSAICDTTIISFVPQICPSQRLHTKCNLAQSLSKETTVSLIPLGWLPWLPWIRVKGQFKSGSKTLSQDSFLKPFLNWKIRTVPIPNWKYLENY